MEQRAETRIAWTEKDGLERAPRGPNGVLAVALAGVLIAVFSGIIFTDTLCPEHRAWVEALAFVALTATVVSAVGLLRRWATAGVWTLGAATCGVAIGVLDAAHSEARGRIIAAAFLAVAIGAVVLAAQQLRLHRWAVRVDRALGRSMSTDALASNDPVDSSTRVNDAVTSADRSADATVSTAD